MHQDDRPQMPEPRRFTSCRHKGCKSPPAYWYESRDQGEVSICAVHGAKMAKVVQDVGGHLQLIPLHEHEIGSPGDDPTTQEGGSDAQVSEGDAAG